MLVNEQSAAAMERSSKLVDLTLVTKYYSVENYSYPRKNSIANSYKSRTSSDRDRSSLGSQASTPGLIEDRTDSEASADDDYQYHTHTTELWDSFWQHPRFEGKPREQPVLHPKKQYPALIPSPQQHRKKPIDLSDGLLSPSWPLRDSGLHKAQRRPAATYSPFPNPIVLPPKSPPISPSWQCSRPPTPTKPQRPPRPDERLLTPCIRKVFPATSTFTTLAERPAAPFLYTPVTFLEPQPKASFEQRPTTSCGHRPSVSTERGGSISAASDSGFDYAAPQLQHRQERAKHMAQASCPALRPESEPQSVFEYDDDSDSGSHGNRFIFRFHKRSDSDNRRSAKSPTECSSQSSATQRKRRNRSSTVPPSSRIPQPEQDVQVDGPVIELAPPPPPRRKRAGGGDVLGRMLGRRSR